MKYITEIYSDSVKKSASPEKIARLKNIWKHVVESHYDENMYGSESIAQRWKTDKDTGFYLNIKNGTIYMMVARIPEFEDEIANSRGYSGERVPNKRQKQSAKCFMHAWDNIGGYGDNKYAVSVVVMADVFNGELIRIDIPEDLDAYEESIRMEKHMKWLEEMELHEKSEQERRSQHMTITVGMWEDMLNKICELEARIDNRY
jgi:hypothetical protein